MAKRKPIGERLIESLGGLTRADADAIRHRAYEAGYNDASEGNDEPVSGTLASYGYRSASAGGSQREAAKPWEDQLNTLWAHWQMSPVVRRIAKLMRDYIVGDGVTVTCDDEDVLDVLNKFWLYNDMDEHVAEFGVQLPLFGAQMFPVFVKESSDGAVRLGYIDPQEIERVICRPDNGMDRRAVVVKPLLAGNDTWIKETEKRVFRIVQMSDSGDNAGRLLTAKQAMADGLIEGWELAMLSSYGLSEYTGTCLYYRVNAMSNQALGQSDFLSVADVIDQADETLFALGEREQMAGYFSFDVMLSGATPNEVAERAKALAANPPRKGSVNVHNENETWTMNAPDLKQQGSVETVKEQLAWVLGGLGIPVPWYGRGDETNRATAQAQGDPTWRSLQREQGQMRDMIVNMCEFVRDQARMAGMVTYPDDDPPEIGVIMPEMTMRDLSTLSAALGSIVPALDTAQGRGWIKPRESVEVLAKVIAEFGVEIEVPETDEEVVEEEPDIPPQLMGASGVADQSTADDTEQMQQIQDGQDQIAEAIQRIVDGREAEGAHVYPFRLTEAARVTGDGLTDPLGDIKDATERRLTRLLKSRLNGQLDDVMATLGDPPDFGRLTEEFWATQAGLLIADIRPEIETLAREAQAELIASSAVGINWEIPAEQAIDWATRYTYDLVRGINNTTRTVLQKKIAQWFQEPTQIGQLRADLAPWFGQQRAQMIAVTETTRAAAEGQRQAAGEAQAVGITMEAVWRTLRDEKVCPQCSPLDGKPESEWGVDAPPRHVNCRCFITHRVVAND